MIKSTCRYCKKEFLFYDENAILKIENESGGKDVYLAQCPYCKQEIWV